MVWRHLEKLNIELPYDPGLPFLGVSTMPTAAKGWEQATCPSMDGWAKRLGAAHKG